MNKYIISYHCNSEILAKETKEFKSIELAISYVNSLENVFAIKKGTKVNLIFKDKLTNVKITPSETYKQSIRY